MRQFIIIAAIAGTVMSGCAAAQRAMPGSMSNAAVIGTFNSVDLTEIDAARLAKDKGSSPAVREFADRMIREHTTMLQNRQQLAKQLNIQPETPSLATSMKSTHDETMERLRTKSGSDFDRAYLEYQVKMHEQAVKLAQDTGESSDNARLKQHLMEARPDLQSHLAAAKSVQRQILAKEQ